MPGWENFFVANVGASAALAGLVFVGMSINLARIMALPGVPERAAETLAILAGALVASVLMLIPDQSASAAGLELLILGIGIWFGIVVIQSRYRRRIDPVYRRFFWRNVLLTQLATLPAIAAGVAILTRGAGGLYWLVPGIVISYLVALLNGWVLMIEINR